jgi:hypothetical protein
MCDASTLQPLPNRPSPTYAHLPATKPLIQIQTYCLIQGRSSPQ